LETPEEFAQWLQIGEKLDAERQVKKDAIEEARLIRLKKIPRPQKPREPAYEKGSSRDDQDDETSD
jgi:ribosome biogenesis GTPase A